MNGHWTPCTVVLDARGPQNRGQFFDALKAFVILTGREARKMVLPLATYEALKALGEAEWGRDDYFPPLQAGDGCRLGGVEVTIGRKFRML